MEKAILEHPYNIQEINEDTANNPLVQALLALREESYSKARDAIEEGLAIIRDKQGKVPIKEAIKVFTKGIIMIEDPLNESETLVQLLICRAQANLNLENNLSVIEDVDRALKITKGRRADAYVMKFKALMRMKKYDELISIYKLIKDV
jgi:tetratricopeptide (TPR) repeat protein